MDKVHEPTVRHLIDELRKQIVIWDAPGSAAPTLLMCDGADYLEWMLDRLPAEFKRDP